MTDPRLPITGGCLCGAIRYKATEPPVNGGYCHCETCRRSTGGLHWIGLFVPLSGFRLVKGEPNYYRSSDVGERGFCSQCGSGVVSRFEGSKHATVWLGSLDHPEDWPVDQPGWWGHVYVANKVPWEVIADGLTQADGDLADCGTSLSWEGVHEYYGDREIVELHVGTLDNPENFPPPMHVCDGERISWMNADDGLPRYEFFAPD